MPATYTISAHLCKQIYASWRQTRPPAAPAAAARDTKRSMDSDRSVSTRAGSPEETRPSPVWRFQGRR
jgi:hypothetical protein